MFANELHRHNPDSKQILWDNEVLKSSKGFKSIAYDEYLNDDNMLKKALQSIIQFGAVIIENVISYF